MSIPAQCLTGAVLMMLFVATCAYAGPGQKDGTIEDFQRIKQEHNIAGETLELPVAVDASGLTQTNYYSKHSKAIELKPDTRYTLGVTYRATGPSLVSAGMKWQIPGEPSGLVDTESIRARWPQSNDWELQVLTFRSDHEHTTARIILKAYGAMSLEVKDVAVVEGWYCD
ncbi:MAG: hypothetical protein ACLFWB_13905 [Armatimonadota bacterium]